MEVFKYKTYIYDIMYAQERSCFSGRFKIQETVALMMEQGKSILYLQFHGSCSPHGGLNDTHATRQILRLTTSIKLL